MKNFTLSVLSACLVLSLAACSFSPSSAPSPSETPEAHVDEYLNPEPAASSEPFGALSPLAPSSAAPDASASGEGLSSSLPALYDAAESQALLSGVIDEQSYELSLSGWGDVRFCPVAPPDGSNEDVRFYLVDANNCIVFEFPETSDGNILSGVSFGELLSVACLDFDSDGRSDIIVHLSYRYPSGQTYRSVVLFSQPDGEDAFVPDKYADPNLAAYLILNDMVGSVADILSGIDSYWTYRAQLS